MPCLNFYHELFYKDNIKVIPINLEKLLTARGLAYWIMDDGGNLYIIKPFFILDLLIKKRLSIFKLF